MSYLFAHIYITLSLSSWFMLEKYHSASETETLLELLSFIPTYASGDLLVNVFPFSWYCLGVIIMVYIYRT